MKSMRWMVLGAGLLLNAVARSESWEPAGLYGGWPNDFARDAQGGIVSSMSGGGVYRLRSGDNLWERIRSVRGEQPRSVETGAPGTIYLGTDGSQGDGFQRSTDDGQSWQTLTNVLSYEIVHGLTVSADYTKLYACTYGSGLFRSTDNGTSFTPVTSLPTSYPTFVTITPSGHLFVGAELGTVNLFFSADAGVSWQPRDAGLPADVVGLALDPTNSTLYAASGAGIHRSTDNGLNWTSMGAPAGAYSDVAVRGGRVYGAHFANVISGGRVYYSDDQGASWTQDAGLPGQSVMRFLNTPEWLYLGVTGPGPYRRGDTGSSWERKAEGMTNVFVTDIEPDEANGQVHVVAEQMGILSSSDGVSWNPTGPGIPPYEFIYDLETSPSGHLYASGAYNGIYRSSNGGGSWSIVSPAPATALATNEWGHVYAGSGNRIRRSLDLGVSWSNLPMLTGGVTGIADIACLGTEVYAATGYFPTGGRGVYRSTDGLNFVPFNTGLANLDATSIGIDPDPMASCRVSVGTRAGLYDLSGLTWQLNASSGLGSIQKVRKWSTEKMAVFELLLRKLQALCDWADSKGVEDSYFSDFAPFMPALPAHGAGTPQLIRLLGTYGNGLWRSIDPTTGVEGPNANASGNWLGVGRNPFTRITELPFTLSRPGPVRLEVFDAAGRSVTTLVDGWREAGQHRAQWDATHQSAGIYFGRMTTAGSTLSRRLLLVR